MIQQLKKNKQAFIQTFYSILALFSKKYGFKKQEYDYYQTYNDGIANNKLGSCLIGMFDGKQIHCGLTDRFKGICTIYEFSKEYNLPFYLYYKSPFDITDYLEPNQYNWKVTDGDVLYNKNTSIPVFLNNWQSNTSFHKAYLKHVIRNNPGKQIHVYSDSPYYINRYVDDFHFLFKYSNLLQESIEQCLDEMGTDKYCAMSFRFLMLLGDFKEEHAHYKVLDDNQQKSLMAKCEKQILKIRRTRNLKNKILITADSKKFLDYMNRYEFIYIVPGEIEHIDNSHTNKQNIFQKTFLDMILLSKATEIFQLHTGDMYKNSAFAHQAALLGRKKYTKIEF